MKKAFISTMLGILFVLLACSGAIADTLTMPASLTEISEEAFYEDTSLDEVILNEGIKTIGTKAFAYSSIQRIYLPDSLDSIADDAFIGCAGLVGYGPDNTVASRFFDSHAGLTFEREEEWVSSPLEDFVFSDNGDGTCSIIRIHRQ